MRERDQFHKIAVIGNAGGGKTRLSRRLSELHQLPVVHVDSIQFLPGMNIRPQDETRSVLRDVAGRERWLIDGFGPLDLIEQRFQLADQVVFIDFPLWRHAWWCSKRQIKSFWQRREELPIGCNEATFAHTVKLFKTLWRVHKQMRPELVRILQRQNLRGKVIFIQNLKQWNRVYRQGVSRDYLSDFKSITNR